MYTLIDYSTYLDNECDQEHGLDMKTPEAHVLDVIGDPMHLTVAFPRDLSIDGWMGRWFD